MYLPSYSFALFRINITYLKLVSLKESVSFLKLGDKCDTADKITFFFFFFFLAKIKYRMAEESFYNNAKEKKVEKQDVSQVCFWKLMAWGIRGLMSIQSYL